MVRCRYETTNHLWLILEYCVGGDLRSLLRADKQLPEATVLRFARDLAAALQYLHSTGAPFACMQPWLIDGDPLHFLC
jgi:serine/threonine-protein kinase ULK4